MCCCIWGTKQTRLLGGTRPLMDGAFGLSYAYKKEMS